MNAGETFRRHMEKDGKEDYLFFIFDASSNEIVVKGIVKNLCPCCIDHFCLQHGQKISDQLGIILGVSYIPRTEEYEHHFKELEETLKESNVDCTKYDMFMINFYSTPHQLIGVNYE
jgi:hypothetical protein